MDINWPDIFFPDTPLVEIILRGSIMYLALFCFLRFILRRQAGSLSLTDLLVVVLMADAAQNAMADDYHSIADGVVLVGTLVAWNAGMECLAYHSRWFEHIVHPQSILLINRGRLLQRNMRQEFITRDDLLSRLHEEGLEHFSQVKRAYLEGDGKISIIKA